MGAGRSPTSGGGAGRARGALKLALAEVAQGGDALLAAGAAVGTDEGVGVAVVAVAVLGRTDDALALAVAAPDEEAHLGVVAGGLAGGGGAVEDTKGADVEGADELARDA